MATTKQKVISSGRSASSGSYIQGQLIIQNTAYPSSNTSSGMISIFVRKGNTDMTLTEPTEGGWKYTLKVNGETFSDTITASVLEAYVYLDHVSWTADHNLDGAGSIDVSLSITAPAGTNYEGHTVSLNFTHDLETIDRVPTFDSLTCSTAYLDGTITALYTPSSALLYNQRLVYANVDDKLTLIRSANLGRKSAAQQTSTINFSESELNEIYKLVRRTAKVKIRVSFKAYSDSGYSSAYLVGNEQYREITLMLPASVAPTAGLAITPVNTNDWLASKNIYAAGLSGAIVKAVFGVSEWTALASYNIVYDGTTYNAKTINITTLKKTGNIQFTANAVDTRGLTAKATKSINVLPYSPPAVTTVILERGTYDTTWTANENGEDLRVVFKITLALANNGNTYNATFELDGASAIPDHGATTELGSEVARAVYFLNVNSEISHDLTVLATDKVGKTGSTKLTVPTAQVTMEFNKSGTGIAFGKTSEKEKAFECAWPAYFSGYAYTNGFRIPLVQWGTVTVTPSAANTPTSKVVPFTTEFPGNPAVLLTPQTTAPGTTVLGVGTNDRSTTGITVWVTRANTQYATTVHWLAVY